MCKIRVIVLFAAISLINSRTVNISKAQIACDYYKENVYKLKEFSYRSSVFGGVNVWPKEYLYMAALGYGNSSDIQWICGGTLISTKHVLTAGHCLDSLDYGPVKYVRLGELDFNSTNPNNDKDPQDYLVESVTAHPDYKYPKTYHDIAVLQLNREVRFNDFIQPACLPTNNDKFNNDRLRLIATGWGIIDNIGNRNSHLQEVSLVRFEESQCKLSFPRQKRRLPMGIIDQQLCAGSSIEGQDTCQGDSGGPLAYANVDKVDPDSYRGYTLLGITSFGNVCGTISSPGVYTKVSSYVPWIESLVWPDTSIQ